MALYLRPERGESPPLVALPTALARAIV